MTVIDFHLHVMDLEQLQPWTTEYLIRSSGRDLDYLGRLMTSPELLVEMLRQNGVDYAVVITEISPITTGVISRLASFGRSPSRQVSSSILKARSRALFSSSRTLSAASRALAF